MKAPIPFGIYRAPGGQLVRVWRGGVTYLCDPVGLGARLSMTVLLAGHGQLRPRPLLRVPPAPCDATLSP